MTHTTQAQAAKTRDLRILICGDRNWDDQETIFNFVGLLSPGTVIIEGCARGADRIAELAALTSGLQIEHHPANWKLYGRAAGPIRNREMLNSHVDLVWAFHDDLNKSKGTVDTVNAALKMGIQVDTFPHQHLVQNARGQWVWT